MPSFLKGKNEPIEPEGSTETHLKITQRVVTYLAGEHPIRGSVRFIGKDKDWSGKLQTIVGLELVSYV